ncbi:DUF3105 domain-containing protein [Janibacter sp. G1551]|uniref:DUF3105 domain-containing protein n=1 Tax=Janibacter sp. G1551 TaxID=3420440 RepID=UPI003D01ADB7
MAKKTSTRGARDERSARLAQLKREQQAAERKRRLASYGAGGLVIALILGVVAFVIIREQMNKPDLSAVKSYDYTGSQHTSEAVKYKENPPVGGEHNPAWLNCGIYDSPVPSENAVHSLEHGAVWITYPEDLPEADVKKLEDETPDTYAILSPYKGIDTVFVSGWGKQLELTGADDNRLGAFVKEYRQSPQVPEPGAACTGGTDGTDDLVK